MTSSAVEGPDRRVHECECDITHRAYFHCCHHPSTPLETSQRNMDVPGQTDAGNLFDVIDRQRYDAEQLHRNYEILFTCTNVKRYSVHGLNLEVPESARELIKPWNERDSTEKYADSSVDDQLVIHVPFTRNVRIRSILLKLGTKSTVLSMIYFPYSLHSVVLYRKRRDNSSKFTNIYK